MALRVYYDLMSQPARAVLLFLKCNDISYVGCPIALRRGEQNTNQEFCNVNPMRKVPAIKDGDFCLSESVAILKYLARKYSVPDHWYPHDLCARAKVDEYMAWQHANTRQFAAMYFREMVLLPMLGGQPNLPKAEEYREGLQTTLSTIEETFLAKNKYLCGQEISIADLLGVCELEQTLGANLDCRDGHPIISTWMSNVTETLSPHWGQVNSILYGFAKKVNSKMQGKL